MRTILVAVLLTACSSGTKSSTPPTNNGGGTSEPAHTACTTDADCVVVETACCDHCNGGKAEAFNSAFADGHKAAGCGETMCTQMACGAAVATCDAGTCKATIAPMQ